MMSASWPNHVLALSQNLDVEWSFAVQWRVELDVGSKQCVHPYRPHQSQ